MQWVKPKAVQLFVAFIKGNSKGLSAAQYPSFFGAHFLKGLWSYDLAMARYIRCPALFCQPANSPCGTSVILQLKIVQQFHHKNFHAATKKVFNQLAWIGHFRWQTKDNNKWRNKMIWSCGQLYIRVQQTVFVTLILPCSFASKNKYLVEILCFLPTEGPCMRLCLYLVYLVLQWFLAFLRLLEIREGVKNWVPNGAEGGGSALLISWILSKKSVFGI